MKVKVIVKIIKDFIRKPLVLTALITVIVTGGIASFCYFITTKLQTPFRIEKYDVYHICTFVAVCFMLCTAQIFYAKLLILSNEFCSALMNTPSARLFTYIPVFLLIMISMVAMITIHKDYIWIHLVCMVCIFVCFTFFNQTTLKKCKELKNDSTQEISKIAKKYLLPAEKWRWMDFPALIGYVCLLVYFLIHRALIADADQNNFLEQSHIFVSGAIGFHLIVSSVLFIMDNWRLVIKGTDSA